MSCPYLKIDKAFLIATPMRKGSSGFRARILQLVRGSLSNNAYLVSWIARIFNLKNSMSRNPYACRFIVLILLFVPLHWAA